MASLINRPVINTMLSAIQEKANSKWLAMYRTPTYQRITHILAKSDDKITYVDKEDLREGLHLLCDCLGIYYYGLLKEACQH